MPRGVAAPTGLLTGALSTCGIRLSPFRSGAIRRARTGVFDSGEPSVLLHTPGAITSQSEKRFSVLRSRTVSPGRMVPSAAAVDPKPFSMSRRFIQFALDYRYLGLPWYRYQ